MDTRTLLRERLRRSRDWVVAIDELEKELEASGTKPEQSEWLFELAALVEDVIPERERALGLYQRAWKLHPDNLKALSRAREVYGEIGRFEMVAKLGEMELRSPAAPTNLAAYINGTSVLITWSAVSNLTYRVQYQTNLIDGPWSSLVPDVTATNAVATAPDNPGDAPVRFYRILIVP